MICGSEEEEEEEAACGVQKHRMNGGLVGLAERVRACFFYKKNRKRKKGFYFFLLLLLFNLKTIFNPTFPLLRSLSFGSQIGNAHQASSFKLLRKKIGQEEFTRISFPVGSACALPRFFVAVSRVPWTTSFLIAAVCIRIPRFSFFFFLFSFSISHLNPHYSAGVGRFMTFDFD